MKLNLKVWRQKNTNSAGNFEEYKVDASPDMSFLEMFDVLNEQLIETGKEPVAFDHDCREGICGMCSMVINGVPHGPEKATTTCQLHMRKFKTGDTIWVDRQPIVYIYGEVQRPGPMRLERGMTLMQSLATGGGLTQRGTEKGIRVHRKGADGKVQVITPTLDDRMQDGDVVYVRESLF